MQGQADRRSAESQDSCKRLGHYNSAMLHYGGEWYWGVDRLHYLTQRLDRTWPCASGQPDTRLASIRQAMHVSLPIKPPSAAKTCRRLEYFHSIRSPYSYLALQRTSRNRRRVRAEMKLRPVLPMVMRGMQVPRAKLLYIARDTCREARTTAFPSAKLRIPSGRHRALSCRVSVRRVRTQGRAISC